MSLEITAQEQTPSQQVPETQAPEVFVIEPTTSWSSPRLGELWQYRDLIWFLVLKDIKSRYRQMALGTLWIIIRPVTTMIVFSVLFGTLANLPSDDLPYPIFAYTALLPWTYFSGAAIAAVNSLVSQMGLISKVYFPRLVVPIAAVLSGLLDFGVSFCVLIGMMIFYHFSPTPAVLLLPLYILLTMVTSLAIGLWGAALTVRFRDFSFIVSYGIQFAMYVTPVIYSASLIPERWQTIYRLNPMFWVVEGFRWALLRRGTGPEPLMLIPIGFVLLMLLSGAFVFLRTQRNIVDLL